MAEIPILVIYHKNCHDGCVAAFTVWKFYRERSPQHERLIEFIQVQPGTEAPNTTGKIVYILDVIFSKRELLQMIEESISLLVIDHHDTSEEILDSIPENCKIYDKTECASTLTWSNFYPETPVPLLYEYIKSRDLFLNDREFINEFHIAFDIAIRNANCEFEFDKILPYCDNTQIYGLINIGKILNGYQKTLVAKTVRNLSFFPIRLKTGKLVIVGYINASLLASDIAAACLETYPFLDFCASFYVDTANSLTQFQLRSTDEREDVSIIARDHGGGGQRNSAGVRIYNTSCRLNYEHLNPTPLLSLYNNKEFRLNTHLKNIFTDEYEKLLRDKFPNTTLKIALEFN